METKQQLAERADRNSREATLASLMLTLLVRNEKPVATESFKYDHNTRYVLKLYAPKAPHGGITLAVFYYKGQKPAPDVMYLDNLDTRTRGLINGNGSRGDLAFRDAVDRLLAARRTALQN